MTTITLPGSIKTYDVMPELADAIEYSLQVKQSNEASKNFLDDNNDEDSTMSSQYYDSDDEYDEDEDEDEDMNDDDDDMPSGKKMPLWLKKKMAKKDSAIAELADRLDSLAAEIETKDGEIAVLQAIVGRTDAEEATEHADAEAIEAEVQARLDSMFEAYADAEPYLPAGFKLDATSTPATIQSAALSTLDTEFKLDSAEAIAGAYAAMKRFSPKRQDSSSQLNGLLYQTLPTPAARIDATPLSIPELARLDSADPRLAALDFRTQGQVRSYRVGREKITTQGAHN
ncbi:MAG: DUF724 domain-containing protein [Stenomitos rutilans HA7619-LM2]|jgi:hypothetical protein|nr:DUF724 domain-containing protein [Stenomitos rutilans HA7619-LM2]MBW4469453.1 DUF724 domain-containing protein [Stenomitos rutilans HA7619-LM2]